MKTCTKCKGSKLEEAFPRNSRYRDLLDSWCKQCRADVSAARRAADPEKAKAIHRRCREKRGRAWHEANREKIRARQQRYAERNRAKARRANAAWRDKNRESINEKARLLRATDERKVYMNVYCRGRQARQRMATPAWADLPAMRRIYAEARRQRLAGADVHVDHIVPIKGVNVCGLHWEGNLQILPAKDNIKKGNRLEGKA